MNIAIYSGSFNPIHNGHLAIAEAALASGWDEVWMVVSPQNPHKNDEELWPFDDRYKMVELAIGKVKKIKVSDCENFLPRPSYTINTLEYLHNMYLHHHFSLLIGGDNLQIFHLWKDYQRIIDSFGLIVYPRSAHLSDNFKDHPNYSIIKAPLLDISSSEIRKRLAQRQSIHNLVSTEVEKYILQELLPDRSKSDI